jgi:hypothetical protein
LADQFSWYENVALMRGLPDALSMGGALPTPALDANG